MSFSGFGGFGQNNNANTQTASFGGFGQNTNNNTGSAFGANNANTSFGQNNNSGGLFGGNNNTATTAAGGFGSGTSAFGANNNNTAFGANKTGFGATNAGGGLFGSSNNTTNNANSGTFGGFGNANSNANTNTTSAFGGGGGLFGATANKPAFGTSTATPSLFGAANNANTSNTTGFGTSTGFGAGNAGVTENTGTANTAFQAFTEKEGTSNATNNFQNILFQDPYKKWSADELRLADYTQGRRHGNPSGAGAFGVSSNFGGGFGANNQATTFGNNNNTATNTGGLFGASTNNNANNATGFGGTGASAFGANNNATNSAGLFGSAANKPAGGLFGSTTNTQQAATGFGANAGAGFGANNAFGGNNNSGGLFGANNQAKPAGGLFGAAANTAPNNTFGTNTGTAFGATNTNASGGLFGNNNAATNNQPATGGLFGNNTQQQTQQTGGLFGGTGFGQQNNAQQQTGNSLFGANNQAKPAGGLFGTNTAQTGTAGGGLFGAANNQQQQGTNAFGASNNAAGGSLFGGAKPGGGLFGASTNQAANTGAGLFGGNAQNQQSGTGLFGGANNQQQKPSLFGAAQNTGGSLFGAQNNQNPGSSLFGGSMNQQNAGLGNSMLNNSQQANNAPQGLTANLNDVSAYGSPSLFGSSNNNEVANPGPLATPLNSSAKPKRGSILAMSKMAPASASRYGTPQKRAYGFSYSTYGTPGGSPASSIASTPGTLGRSLLGPSSSGSLSKSMSTNNLRRNFNTDDSILAPGAFSSSSGPRWYGSTGSKKLVINRDIRSDLFSTPQKDKLITDSSTSSRKLSKRVSFDTSNVEPDGETIIRGALPAPESSPITQADETPRQNRQSNGSNGSRTPEADTSRSSDLKIVHEEDNSATPEANSVSGVDKLPGDYWSEPSFEDIKNMNRMQRQHISNFVIGRHNVGSIAFKFPVDITGIEVEELYGGVIQLEPRSATVYPVTAKKPPVGKGLNVPSKISLEQSWPRGSRDKVTTDPKRFKKHVDRLKRIPDTTFESYDKDSGVWVFSVEHFTTYGFDNSEDESDDEMATDETLELPAVPSRAQQFILNSSVNSNAEEEFEPRKSKALPGAFDHQEMMDEGDVVPSQQSFLGNSSADSVPNDVRLSLDNEDPADMGEGYDLSDNEDVARSSVRQHHAAEQDGYSSQEDQDAGPVTPGGILRARMRAVKDSAGPLELEVADGDDWMEMLRKTVSPVKRDRQLLKGLNDSSPRRGGALTDPSFEADQDLRKSAAFRKTATSRLAGLQAPTQPSMEKGRGFATSIDLMNSLFEKPSRTTAQNHRVSIPAEKGFPKWPYERQPKSLDIDDAEQAFHDASRPTWGPQETLVITRKPKSLSASRASFRSSSSDILFFQRSTIQNESQTVQLGKFSLELSKKFLGAQDRLTEIRLVDEVPVASLRSTSVGKVFHHEQMNDPASIHEKRVWELASILFDDLESNGAGHLAQSVRKSKLSTFWTTLVDAACSSSIGLAGSSEEKAVACLAGHRVSEACKHLLEGKNFRLGTLVSLIGTSDVAKKDMKEQIKAWHDSKMLSEFSEPIRAMYELLSGNVCVCEGLKGVPVEDRLDSFVISKKFGLDWKQAFGLRLWYSISQQEDLSIAVRQFLVDIQQDKEALPQPWYMEQGINPLWDDDKANQRQDLLWGLLQLYADPKADLEAILRPENSQLSPLDMRLAWQLGVALVATGKVSFGTDGNEKGDAASIAYASQLTSAGEWLEAIFVLLHLSEPLARKKAIQDHLCRHAGLIDADLEGNLTLLTEKFQIPASWIWEALALYNRSVKKDATAEVQCLLKAGSFSEAHRVLSQQVAPLAIIERGYKGLSTLLSQFDGRQEHISDWQLGGEVYNLFLALLQHRNKGDGAPRSLLEQLAAGLYAMNGEVADEEIIRFAALSDMADETAKEILKSTRKKQDTEFRSKILRLPLTQDRLLAYSVDLGMERYREVMSH